MTRLRSLVEGRCLALLGMEWRLSAFAALRDLFLHTTNSEVSFFKADQKKDVRLSNGFYLFGL